MRRPLILAFMTCWGTLTSGQPVLQGTAPETSATGELPATRLIQLPDVEVQTQTGARVRAAELLQGRVAAVNFIFTSCTTVCPLMGARFARLQVLLGEQSRDIALVSISIDPVNDTPERLTEWSGRLGARPGWTLVTGFKRDVDRLLRALGVASAEPTAHTPVVLIGDGQSGAWERVDGLIEPSRLAQMLAERVARRAAPGAASADLRRER